MLNEVVDPAHFFDAAGDLIETAANAAERKEPPRVGLCRECPPIILSDGKLRQALRLEQLWGLIAHTSTLDLLCGYPSASFEKHETVFDLICSEHSSIYATER